MVNPNRLVKITKGEAKDLLDKAQNIIEKDILGPNFKRDKLLKKDKTKKKEVSVEKLIPFLDELELKKLSERIRKKNPNVKIIAKSLIKTNKQNNYQTNNNNDTN